MTDLSIINTANLKDKSDDNILQEIGQFVRHHRLNQNKTQADLAREAGINRTTLSDLELGRRCQILTLIQILRTLEQLDALNTFEIDRRPSPIELAKQELNARKRASRSKPADDQPSSDW